MATSSSFTRGLQTSKSEAKELGEDTEVPVFSSIVENKKKLELGVISDFTKKLLLVQKILVVVCTYIHMYFKLQVNGQYFYACMHLTYVLKRGHFLSQCKACTTTTFGIILI